MEMITGMLSFNIPQRPIRMWPRQRLESTAR
jgi:hypothetical protein